MKNKIFIIHFGDIAKYPPAFNIVRYFSETNSFAKILVSTRSAFQEELTNVYWYNTLISKYNNRIFRLLNYIWFYCKTFVFLLKEKPGNILYYETLSFPPIYLYKIFTGKKVHIFCHYHEYTSLTEYKRGMQLAYWIHFIETSNYKHFKWISQTNSLRCNLFFKEHNYIKKSILKVLPNYPPAKWENIIKNVNRPHIPSDSQPLKLVYVGSLDLNTMYTEKLCNWIINQKGNVLLDIYSNQITEDAISYFNNLDSNYINLLGSILYDKLPETLPKYHVGIIIYKPHSENVIFCEPNKYFEYLVCGLDVWYPNEIISLKSHVQLKLKPLTIELDFNNIKSDILEKYYSNCSYNWKKFLYSAENINEHLLKQIIQENDH